MIDDVIFDVRLRRANDADRFIEGDVHRFFLSPDHLAIDADVIALRHLRAEHSGLTVTCHTPGLDPFIRFPPRTHAGFADVLVKPHARDWVSRPRTRRFAWPV